MEELTPDLLEDVVDAILEAEACIDADPLAYTEFNPVQIRAVRAFTVDGAKMILMVKPNGVGGTFVLAALMASGSPSGFKVTCSRREERISFVESDGPVYWQHRGVSWFLFASPTS